MTIDAQFERWEQVLRSRIAPLAQTMDHDPAALAVGLGVLAEEGLLALKRPAQFGGPGLTDSEIRRFQIMIARYSGALAFLQTQHQGVSGMLAGSPNRPLAEAYLPGMHDGTHLVGVGFSQLRRPGPPVVRAEAVEGGYRIDGTVPWVTGFGFFHEFVVGASLPDGRAVFGLVPLQTQDGNTVSEPMDLAAMKAAGTVTVALDGYVVSDEKVITVRDAGWIANSDSINIAQQGSFALGCALAGIDVVRDNASRRKLDSAARAADALQAEWDRTLAAAEQYAGDTSSESVQLRLELRAKMIDLAVRCAHAAVVSSSGAANSGQHPAQRIYREALVFSVSAQTGAILDATLDRIVAGAR